MYRYRREVNICLRTKLHIQQYIYIHVDTMKRMKSADER